MNSFITPRRAVLGTVLLLSGLGAFSALANTTGAEGTHVIVSYGDLDMSKPEGAEILYRRITSAARRACNEPSPANLVEMSRFEQCYQVAVTNAVSSVHEQTLTALHRVRSQKSIAG